MNRKYEVRIKELGYPSPSSDDPCWGDTRTETVGSLAEARELIDGHVPVSLESGDPMHYDTGDGDEMDIGRVFHYWKPTHGRDDRKIWVDAWVSVEEVQTERVKWDDVAAA